MGEGDLLLEMQRTHLVIGGGPSFVRVAVCLWNGSPYSLRVASSVETLKVLLKTFYSKEILLRRYFSIGSV